MLGKLMKHEWKAQYKLYGGIYLFVLLLAVVASFFDKMSKVFPENAVLNVGSKLTITMFIVALVVMVVATLIICILRYRNNLLKDEGYLMHTLPVSATELVMSKLIASMCWYVADCLVLYITLSIAIWDFSWPAVAVKSFEASAGVTITALAWLGIVAYTILSMITALSQFYVCMSVGYVSSKSKDVMSFVAYIVTYIISQVASIIAIVIVCVIYFGSPDGIMQLETEPYNFMVNIFISSAIVMVILSLIYNLVSVKMLSHKLNLE